MAKLLYGLKLCLFQDQFHLSTHECTACWEFSLFVTLVSVKAWMSCTSSCDAPANDLGLIQQLAIYEIFATEITCNESVHNKCRCQCCFIDTTDNTQHWILQN